MNTIALILAGGRSTRMGTPKDCLRLADGRTMLEHTIAAVEPLAIPICIAIGKDTPAPEMLRYLRDEDEFQGPLAAIAHAQRTHPAVGLLVLACDQVLLTAPLLAGLLAQARDDAPTFFCDHEGRSLAPLPGHYPASTAPAIANAFHRGERSPRRWALAQHCHLVPIPPEDIARLRSFNTLQELREAGLLP